MANTKTHIATGVAAGIIVELLSTALRYSKGEKIDIKDLALHGCASVLGGIAGSKLPDVIEPAYNPDHRGFFHSIGFGGLVFCSTRQLNKLDVVNPLVKSFIRGASAGYISHLALDSKTPKGITVM